MEVERFNRSILLFLTVSLLDFTPTYKSKIIVHSSAHSDLVPDVGTHWLGEFDSNGVLPHTDNLAGK